MGRILPVSFLTILLMTAFSPVVKGSSLIPSSGNLSPEFVVYSVYQSIGMGNPAELPRKDYYVNMGYLHGLKNGAILEVMRRVPTYDLANERMYREMIFPIAWIKVIHVESKTAIARLEKLLPLEQVPISMPQTVMVGDVIRLRN